MAWWVGGWVGGWVSGWVGNEESSVPGLSSITTQPHKKKTHLLGLWGMVHGSSKMSSNMSARKPMVCCGCV